MAEDPRDADDGHGCQYGNINCAATNLLDAASFRLRAAAAPFIRGPHDRDAVDKLIEQFPFPHRRMPLADETGHAWMLGCLDAWMQGDQSSILPRNVHRF